MLKQALFCVQGARVRQLKTMQPGWGLRSVQTPPESVSFLGRRFFFDVSPFRAEHLPPPHLKAFVFVTMLYVEGEKKNKTRKNKRSSYLKQRDVERSGLSVILFLSECKYNAVIRDY